MDIISYIKTLKKDKRYNINSYIIETDNIIIFVNEYNKYQSEILSSVEGRNIIITKSI